MNSMLDLLLLNVMIDILTINKYYLGQYSVKLCYLLAVKLIGVIDNVTGVQYIVMIWSSITFWGITIIINIISREGRCTKAFVYIFLDNRIC